MSSFGERFGIQSGQGIGTDSENNYQSSRPRDRVRERESMELGSNVHDECGAGSSTNVQCSSSTLSRSISQNSQESSGSDGSQITRRSFGSDLTNLCPIRIEVNGDDGDGGSGVHREIFQQFYRTIEGHRRWISDVYPNVSAEDIDDLVQSATKNAIAEGRGFAAVYHKESETEGHFHLFHTCIFSNSHCRCSWFKQIVHSVRGRSGHRRRLKSRVGRRIVYCQEISSLYWRKFLQYFTRAGRQIIYLAIGGKTFLQQIDRYQSVRRSEETKEGDGSEECLETCDFQGETCCRKSNEAEGSDGGEEINSQATTSHRKRSNGFSKGEGRGESNLRPVPKKLKAKLLDHQFVMNALREYICVPIGSTCELREWLMDPTLSYYDKTDNDYKRAVNLYQREVSLYTFHDIISLILNAKHIHFLSRTDDHYYNLHDSLKAVECLLDYQYGQEKASFVQRLFDVCEKRIKKLNSMFIRGPPNSGKSWFIDMISSFYINVGYVGNFNKSNAFPLNDCVNRRILIWNEPNIELNAFDTVKMICGGDACQANVKYQHGSTISRTPIIFTSNASIFPMVSVWTSRISFEKQWKSAPMLKDAIKYPHPLTYPILISRYVLTDDILLQQYVNQLFDLF